MLLQLENISEGCVEWGGGSSTGVGAAQDGTGKMGAVLEGGIAGIRREDGAEIGLWGDGMANFTCGEWVADDDALGVVVLEVD